MEQHLVGAEQVVLGRPGDGVLGRHLVRPEAVVVEQEERRQHAARPGPGPGDVRVLGGEHAIVAADGHQALVLRLAARLAGVGGDRPELVVAGHPEQAGEAAAQQRQRVAQVLLGLADVAGDDQPVVREGRQGGQRLARHLVAQVQIGDGVELHRLASD